MFFTRLSKPQYKSAWHLQEISPFDFINPDDVNDLHSQLLKYIATSGNELPIYFQKATEK